MKTIIFDFDGTLADSHQVFMNAWNAHAKKYKYKEVVYDDLEATKHLTIHERAKLFEFPMHKLPLILPKIYRYFKDNVHDVQLFKGIKEMLYELANRGHRIVILSSNKKENIQLLLRQEQIDCVSEVLTSRKLFGKDIVLKKFMRQHNMDCEDILYVGDEVRDIIACNKVNVPFMWVSWGLDGQELIEKENPKYIVHSPNEMIKILC